MNDSGEGKEEGEEGGGQFRVWEHYYYRNFSTIMFLTLTVCLWQYRFSTLYYLAILNINGKAKKIDSLDINHNFDL